MGGIVLRCVSEMFPQFRRFKGGGGKRLLGEEAVSCWGGLELLIGGASPKTKLKCPWPKKTHRGGGTSHSVQKIEQGIAVNEGRGKKRR